jgi:zinc/manganese transport system permease protein
LNLDGLDPVILAPALAAGALVIATHVPLGQQVLKRGIIFIDLAIAQIAGLGVLLATALGFDDNGWGIQVTAFSAALIGAFLLYQCERRWPETLEAVIGSAFVLAASAGILLLAGNPHGGEHLKDLLVGQILWVGFDQLLPVLGLYTLVLAAWFGLGVERRPVLFYVLFALTVTASVQLVGVYLVFASLIIPALAARRLSRRCQSLFSGYITGILGYTGGLLVAALIDLPAGAVIVWMLTLCGVLVSFIVKHTQHDEAPSPDDKAAVTVAQGAGGE